MVRGPAVIQSETTASDGGGGQTVTWSTVYTIWPEEVRAVAGRETEVQGREVTTSRWLFRVRYGPTITTAHRLVYDGMTMNIRTVQDRDGKRDWLMIEAEVGFGA